MSSLSPSQLLEASRIAKLQHFEAGSMIISEGTDANAFYIVSKGNVEVILPRKSQSDVIVVQLGPGKYFGEMEFFHDRRNRASIRASEYGPVEVLAIGYDQLHKLLGKSEVALEALHQAADQHEQENVQKRSEK
jgi:CRP-like cAMP-binding protein